MEITIINAECRCYLSAFAFCGVHGEITDRMHREAVEQLQKEKYTVVDLK